MAGTILKINASARKEGSVSRELVEAVTDRLAASGEGRILDRDVGAAPLPAVSDAWVAANFTPEDARTKAQREMLSLSDTLVEELEQADTVVIGAPIYNFSLPSALKAWIDLVCRARKTFRYTEKGPVGLLTDKKVYVIVASGGVGQGSEYDFMTPYLTHVLGFIGLSDVEFVAADRLNADPDAAINRAEARIASLINS